MRGDRVIFEGRLLGADPCVPHSLHAADGRLWGVFEASFGGRQAPAMVDLRRIG